jgi:putative membrane protein
MEMKDEAKKLFRFLRTKPVPANTNEILALERTKLANERTLLSYIRSSLYLLLGGIALLQLKDFRNIHWLGYVALSVCVIFLAVGIFRYVLLSRRLYKWNRILFVDTISEKVQKQADTRDKMEKQEAEA